MSRLSTSLLLTDNGGTMRRVEKDFNEMCMSVTDLKKREALKRREFLLRRIDDRKKDVLSIPFLFRESFSDLDPHSAPTFEDEIEVSDSTVFASSCSNLAETQTFVLFFFFFFSSTPLMLTLIRLQDSFSSASTILP